MYVIFLITHHCIFIGIFTYIRLSKFGIGEAFFVLESPQTVMPNALHTDATVRKQVIKIVIDIVSKL